MLKTAISLGLRWHEDRIPHYKVPCFSPCFERIPHAGPELTSRQTSRFAQGRGSARRRNLRGGLLSGGPDRMPGGTGSRKRRQAPPPDESDRKSTRLNSSHVKISYAVFCLKKKKMKKCYIA